jgi:hypothetical protein
MAPYEHLNEEVVAIRAELRAALVTTLRLGALLDQINAGCQDTVAALSAAEGSGTRHRSLTLREAQQLRVHLQGIVHDQRAALEQGRRLRDEATAIIARCARRREAALAIIAQHLACENRVP